MLSVLVWNNMRLMENYLEEQITHRANELKPLLNASLAGPLLQEDLATLKEIAHQFNTEEIRHLIIYDATGERMVTVGSPETTGFAIAMGANSVELFFPHRETQLLRMPIQIDQQLVGRVELAMDTSAITEAIETSRGQGFAIALTEVVLSIILLSLLGLAMTGQLQALTEAARAMTNGDMNVRVPVRTRDEVGEAAETFNIMAQRISETQSSLQKSQSRIRMLLDSTGEAIYGIDLDGNCTFVNPACIRVLGYESEDELLDKNIHDLIHYQHEDGTPYPIDQCHVSRSVKFGEEIRVYDEVFWKKDGSCFPIEYCSYPIKSDGEIIGSVVTFNDITERKRAEDEIRRFSEELEFRVELRTAELQVSNHALQDSLEKLNETQEQLIQSEKMAALGSLVAGVAHEINTPIGIGVTAASHLGDKAKKFAKLYEDGILTREDFESFLGAIDDATSLILTNLLRAADLIRSFKQVAVDQTSSEARVFNLKNYLNEVLMSLKPEWKKTRHTVNIDCPDGLELYSYPGAFSQILTNLVMNSLIHGFEDIYNGEINLTVTHNPDEVQLTYHDNGKGIAAENLKRVFEPFYTTKRNQNGSGLGMHIVYNLITQTLGGQVSCESQPGSGTTFEIRIPKTVEDRKAG